MPAVGRARTRRQHLGLGLATVRFRRAADGRPAAVELYRSSGNERIDARARTAVSRLGRNAPAPVFAAPDKVFHPNIIIARDEDSVSDLAIRLARLEKARLAGPAGRTDFVLTADARIAG